MNYSRGIPGLLATVRTGLFATVLCLISAPMAKESLRSLADKRGMLIGAASGDGFSGGGEAFQSTLKREFNAVVSEYQMKFGQVQPSRGVFNFAPGDNLLAFADQNGMKLRGHCLVWHKEASFLATTAFSKSEMLAILKDHITKVVGRYKGRIPQWDVVNEVISNDPDSLYRDSFLFRTMGIDFVDSCFRWAHQADPAALLFYNEYWAEGLGIKSDKTYNLVKGLKARGVPLDGIGLQCHFRYDSLPTFPEMDANIKRLTALGLQVAFTEVDYRIPLPATAEELAKQREVYQGTLQVCLANPGCKTFMVWGVTDAYSWIDQRYPGWGNALLFDRSYGAKPAYEGLSEALSGAVSVVRLRTGPALIATGRESGKPRYVYRDPLGRLRDKAVHSLGRDMRIQLHPTHGNDGYLPPTP